MVLDRCIDTDDQGLESHTRKTRYISSSFQLEWVRNKSLTTEFGQKLHGLEPHFFEHSVLDVQEIAVTSSAEPNRRATKVMTLETSILAFNCKQRIWIYQVLLPCYRGRSRIYLVRKYSLQRERCSSPAFLWLWGAYPIHLPSRTVSRTSFSHFATGRACHALHVASGCSRVAPRPKYWVLT